MYTDIDEVLKRVDSVIKYVWSELNQTIKNNTNLTAFNHAFNLRRILQLSLRLKQAILDMAPGGREYWNYATSVLLHFKPELVAHLFVVLKSYKEGYANYFLGGFNEMVDDELYTDILERAEHLPLQGYSRVLLQIMRGSILVQIH